MGIGTPMAGALYLPLDLTVRFAASLPDLHLPRIVDPATTSGLSLLHAIRTSLPPAHASLKITLISSGRILPLREALSTSIRLPTAKKLGKGRVHDDFAVPSAHHLQSDGQRVQCTIHATFSPPENSLTPAELVAERQEGEALNARLQAAIGAATAASAPGRTSSAQTAPFPSTNESAFEGHAFTQAASHRILQGFDRLAAPEIGIPEADITSLRRQFRALVTAEQADGPPLTPMNFLELEERWLDDAANGNGTNTLGNNMMSQFASGNNLSDANVHQVDDVLWGNILGFFWPLGALFWFARQDGALREGRQTSVFVGLLVNFLFCVIRIALVGGGSGDSSGSGATGIVRDVLPTNGIHGSDR